MYYICGVTDGNKIVSYFHKNKRILNFITRKNLQDMHLYFLKKNSGIDIYDYSGMSEIQSELIVIVNDIHRSTYI